MKKCPPETTKRRPLTRTQIFDNKITNETKVSLFYTNRGYLSFSRANERNFQSNLEEYVVVDQKFCNFALYVGYQQVFAMGLVKLEGLISLLFLEVAEIALVAARLGQFQQLLKTQVLLMFNFSRPHAITCTKHP